jgi:putative hydrolase of the HAD superfamily
MSVRPAVIFDFGNVVAHFDFTRSCSHFGREVNLSGADFFARAKELGFDSWMKVYETGNMSSSEFHGHVCELMGISMEFDEFAKTWGDIFTGNEGVHHVITDLKDQGYSLLLGSNTNEMHFNHYRRQFDHVLSKLDKLVLSYEVGHIKPSADFFHACAAIAERPANECVFIDDLEENIAAARDAGLIGVHYRETPQLIEDLRALGIQVASR